MVIETEEVKRLAPQAIFRDGRYNTRASYLASVPYISKEADLEADSHGDGSSGERQCVHDRTSDSSFLRLGNSRGGINVY